MSLKEEIATERRLGVKFLLNRGLAKSARTGKSRKNQAGEDEIYRERDDFVSKAEAKRQEPNLDKSNSLPALRACASTDFEFEIASLLTSEM